MCLCVCNYTNSFTCTMSYMWRSENKFLGSLSFYYVGPREQSQTFILVSQHDSLSHVTNLFFFCCCSFVTLLTCFTGIRSRASSCMLYRVTLSLINQSIYLFSPSMSNHTLIWAQTRILLLFLLYFYYLDTFDFFFSYFINSDNYGKGTRFVYNTVVHFIFSHSRTL